jgi:hypothetical protein
MTSYFYWSPQKIENMDKIDFFCLNRLYCQWAETADCFMLEQSRKQKQTKLLKITKKSLISNSYKRY